MNPRFLLLSTICSLLHASLASATNPTTGSSNHVRGNRRHLRDTSRRLDPGDDADTSSLLGNAAAADDDDTPAFSGTRRIKSSKKSKSKQSQTLPSKSQQHSNIFQQATRSNETSSTATWNSTIPTDNGYYPPDKVPLRPVQCGGRQPIHSALLVRLVGEPSLVTRYEKMRLEQVVLESYNDWMQSACDGYHRTIDAVELIPIDDINLVTQAHQETWFRDQDNLRNNNDDDSDENHDEALPTNRQLVQPHGDSKQAPLSSAQPSLAPTSVYYDDPNVLYRPLYWLSVSATCRNCPRNSLGNSNLLAKHASFSSTRNETRDTAAHQPVFSAASLILEEVCFCPAKTKNSNNTEAIRGVSNGTSIILEPPEEEPMTIDDLFPDAEAPTSVDLLASINMRIQQLRTTGALVNIESLMQLTEPDYAYYAEEMAQTVEDAGPVIPAEDESEEGEDSSPGQSPGGNEMEGDKEDGEVNSGVASVNNDTANISTTPPVDESPPEVATTAPVQASPTHESKAMTMRLSAWVVATVSALAIGASFWTLW